LSMTDIPLIVVTATVWAYWLGVGRMIVRVRRHTRHRAGIVPERRPERAMWILMVPTIAAWCALPYLAVTHAHAPLALPDFARSDVVAVVLRWIAALMGVACLAATARCWRRMGDQWRMDIGNDQGPLITDGPFTRIRHPIYAYSMLLVLCSAVVLPTWPMLLVAVVHISLFNVKARFEEAHLARVHGDTYARYVARTGRFFPRLATREP